MMEKTSLCRLILLSVCIYVIASIFSDCVAKSLIEQIGWKGANDRIIIGLLVAIPALLLTLVIIYIRSQFKIEHERTEASYKLFNDYAYKAKLYPLEIKKLRELLTHETVQHPHIIFQSAALFERCIDAEVRLLLLTRNDPSLLEDEEAVLANIRRKLGYSYLPLEHPLLSTRNIETGQIMSVFSLTGMAPLIQHAVLVMNKETFFRLQFNNEKEEFFGFSAGSEVRLVFARQGDGVYGIQTEICRIDSPSSFDCLHTLNFKRNQMRQYVRIEVDLPIRIRVLRPLQDAGSITDENLFIDAKLVDISGGGLSFLHEKSFVPGDTVSMRFSLPTGTFSDITGKILRVSLQEGKTDQWYRHHIQYVKIEPQQRERIVKYIFEKQRQRNQLR